MVRLISCAALALLASAASAQDIGVLATPQLDELSGLAVSQHSPALLWGHNDSGGKPALYRIGLDGSDLGEAAVPVAKTGDWEDIAAFKDAQGAALLIADTGDNLLLRSHATLYALRDPGRSGDLEFLWRLDFRFPDGGRDCEAVAVDPLRREILLISKRDAPARLYRLPLPRQPPAGIQTAEFLGTLPFLPPVSLKERARAPLSARFFYMPTAFDISADGLTAAVVTPRKAYVFRRRLEQDWLTAFRGAPAAIDLPEFEQIEAAALSGDGHVLHIGSEGRPAPYARVTVPR